MNKSSTHEKAPSVAALRASGNEINFEEEIVMGDNSTNVIPFKFGTQEVRTLLIDNQPWFVAKDVIASLEYAKTSNPARVIDHVPAQWKGVNPIHTLGGEQQMLMLSEQGLYFFIGRSDKENALPFQMWLAGDVLPAIRKHGRYDDTQSKMQSLIDEVMGKPGAQRLSNVMRCRVAKMSAEHQRSATAKLASAVHACFGVPRLELIPVSQFDAAASFIASYAIEGEYLGPEQAKPQLGIHCPLETLIQRRPEMLEHRGMGQAWLDVSMSDICSRPQDLSLCEKVLCELRDAGYEIDGAWFEVRSLRNRLQELNSFLTGLGVAMQRPTRYAVEVSEGRAAA